MKSRFIAIEGNIGAGKTTLANMLAKDLNARLMLEQFAENPFLPLFYENPEKYAFPLELSFLGERFEQMKNILVADLFRPIIVSDYYILKSLLFARINLGDAEYQLFNKLYHLIADTFPKPDLLIYLNTEVAYLQENIKKRGRSYETGIKDDYLKKLHNSYLKSFKEVQNIPVLIVNTEGKDFVDSPLIYDRIANSIQQDFTPGIQFLNL